MSEINQTYQYKILTAGDGGVGKTTLIHRFIDGCFIKDTKMTIGVDFFIKNIKIGIFVYFDFGGEDRFKKILRGYVSGGHGAILLFDLTRPTSFYSIGEWVNILRNHDEDLPILLLGTKLDLEPFIAIEDSVVYEALEQFKLIDFIKVSSKTGTNVEESFEKIALAVYDRLKQE